MVLVDLDDQHIHGVVPFHLGRVLARLHIRLPYVLTHRYDESELDESKPSAAVTK
jgi:hypothetical protein